MSKEEKFVAWAVRGASGHIYGIYQDKAHAEKIHDKYGDRIIELVEISEDTAANKAAEEGGLPDGWKLIAVNAGFDDLIYWLERSSKQAALVNALDEAWEMFDFDESIAADRASRQVANKAEVDALQWLLTSVKNTISGKPVRNLDEVISHCEKVLATPPATTGASTALTDEPKLRDFIVQWSAALYPNPDELMAAIKANIGQSVAAQAGQVAVPGWKLVPVEPTEEMIAAAYFGGDLDIAIGHAAAYQRAEIGYAAMLAAAPSPAKESKMSNPTELPDLDLPATTDAAREYLVGWHRENLTAAPYFTDYISKTLAGDFAYHLARWLARRAQPEGEAPQAELNEVKLGQMQYCAPITVTSMTLRKREFLEQKGYSVVGYVMQDAKQDRCTVAHGKVEWDAAQLDGGQEVKHG